MPSSDTISCWFLSSFVINWVTCQITGNWHVNQLCIICSILIANWSRDQLCINRSESTGKKFSSLLIDNGSESNLVSSLNNIIDNWSFYSKFFVLAINWPIFTKNPTNTKCSSMVKMILLYSTLNFQTDFKNSLYTAEIGPLV